MRFLAFFKIKMQNIMQFNFKLISLIYISILACLFLRFRIKIYLPDNIR